MVKCDENVGKVGQVVFEGRRSMISDVCDILVNHKTINFNRRFKNNYYKINVPQLNDDHKKPSLLYTYTYMYVYIIYLTANGL